MRPHYLPPANLEDKDALLWSEETLGFAPESSHDEDEETDCYLYWSFDHPFSDFASSLAQLNDLCVITQYHALRTIDELREEWNVLNSGQQKVVDEIGADWTTEAMDALEIQMEDWEFTRRVVARATCFVLLAVFLERTLKALCGEYLPTGPLIKRNRSESTVNFYLRVLREDAHLQFETPQQLTVALDTIRKVRNHFAHGDWDAVEQMAGEIGLRDAFRVVSELLYTIEEGVSSSHAGASP